MMQDEPTENDPPLSDPGMVDVRIDPHGRLVELRVVPGDGDAGAGHADVDALWSKLFGEAGLDGERFTATEPTHTPPRFADSRAAWEGTVAEAPELPLRVEAAALAGRPVWFRIFGPWTGDEDDSAGRSLGRRMVPVFFAVLAISVLVGLVVLARRNLHQGRSDLRGAVRVGSFIFATELVAMLLRGGSLLGVESGDGRLFLRLSLAGFLGVVIFLAYIALEPYVRRLWPTVLISWNRLLAGLWRDPLVGRDLLKGAAAGVVTRFLHAGHVLLPPLLGLPEEGLYADASRYAIGPLRAIAGVPLGAAVALPMLLTVTLVLLRQLMRNDRLAVTAIFLIALVPVAGSVHPILDLLLLSSVMALTLLVLLRVGLLALVGMWLADYCTRSILTTDPSSWTGNAAVVNAVVVVLLTVYASSIALGGRKVLQDEL